MNKLEKIRNILTEREIDALLISDELNQHYVTDFAFSDGLVLITHNHAELITDFRYLEMAENRANKLFSVSAPENKIEFIRGIIKADEVKRIGFEGNTLPYGTYFRYCEMFPEIEFFNVGGVIEHLQKMRCHKRQNEKQHLASSCIAKKTCDIQKYSLMIFCKLF